MYKYIYKVTSH